MYDERLEGNEKIRIPYIAPYINKMSWFVYIVRLNQEIQESLDLISINLVLKDQEKLKLMENDFREITEVIKKVMGDDIKIKYNIVNEIKYPPSGKYMYTFSKIKNEGKIETK